MKNTVKVLSIVLVLVMAVGMLASCAASTFPGIKSRFENAGYEVDVATEATTGEIETEEGVITYTIHTITVKKEESEGSGSIGDIVGDLIDGGISALKSVVVWEFGSDEDLTKAIVEEYQDNEDFQDAIADLQNSDYVNGNCFMVPNLNEDAVDLFKGN